VNPPPETSENGFDPTMHPLGAAGSAERRPWGEFVILDDSQMAKVKRITVDPGQRLSYQMHHHRSEHWTVVAGTAVVTIDGDDQEVPPGRTVEVPVGAAHRVRNDGATPLVFIEVQTGTYFGEDDIVRFEDDYGRAGTD
jgi:mannose-6-phosphate isomerase